MKLATPGTYHTVDTPQSHPPVGECLYPPTWGRPRYPGIKNLSENPGGVRILRVQALSKCVSSIIFGWILNKAEATKYGGLRYLSGYY
jgi:hypothetical protein